MTCFKQKKLDDRNKLADRNKNDAGQALVESAFAASLLLLVFFTIFDFAFMCYAKATMQNAVRTAARYAITGNCSNPSSGCFSSPTNNPQDRLDSIVNLVTSYSWAFTPTVSVACVQGTCPNYAGSSGGSGNCTSPCSNNAGGPGDLVQITATYVYNPIMLKFFAAASYTFHTSSTFKNESFPPPGS